MIPRHPAARDRFQCGVRLRPAPPRPGESETRNPNVDYPRYDPASKLTPLADDELQALDRLLQDLPADGVMTLDGVDGFLTAMLVGPPQWLSGRPTADWLPLVWGGDGDGGPDAAAPFASKRQRKATVVLLLRHLRHLQQQLFEAPADWEPIFSVAEQGADEWTDARDWCTGFLQAVDLDPVAWGEVWSDPALAPLLRLGGELEGGAPPADLPELDDAAVCDELSRAVPDAVLHLLAQRKAPAAGAAA